jgi:D-threonate/D-erythronate kinase
MIVVIADDITGAAELAGISLQYFKKVELYIQTVPKYTKAEVIVICTNSRSMSKASALQITKTIFAAVMQLKPSFLYKKIDSVLRGYVTEELKIQMKQCNQQTALIVPANPSLGRIIKNGKYYIQNKLITKTDFVNDPEFPIQYDNVCNLISATLAKHPRIVSEKGIYIANTPNSDAIKSFVDAVSNDIAILGAGDFYEAILKANNHSINCKQYQLKQPHLFISGTTFLHNRFFIETLNNTTSNVFYLNEEQNKLLMQDISDALIYRKKALIAFKPSTKAAKELRTQMATFTKKVLQNNKVAEILIEGGATAGAIFKTLKIDAFKVLYSLQRGTVALEANGYRWVVKPGSYSLPTPILNLYHQ